MKGFTIVELIIVLIIIGILLTVVSGRFLAGVGTMKVTAASEHIKAHIRLARQRSSLEQVSFAAEFNTATDNYRVYNTSTSDEIKDPLTQKDLNITFSGDPEFDGVTIDSANFGGSNEVSFNSFGEPSSSGSVTISYGDNSKIISVEAVSGRVSIE